MGTKRLLGFDKKAVVDAHVATHAAIDRVELGDHNLANLRLHSLYMAVELGVCLGVGLLEQGFPIGFLILLPLLFPTGSAGPRPL